MASNIDIVIEAVDNLSATVKRIETNVATFSRNVENSTKKVQRSTQKMTNKATKSLDSLSKSFGEVTTNIRRLGAIVGAIYAVRSAVNALLGVADDFKKFNEAMAFTNTIALLTDESLAKLTGQVSDLSVALGKAAPELARGLYDVYSSGFEGAEAMKILEVATQGAIAGWTDAEVAARGLMAVMNAYNRKTGADAVDIMDSMFKTVDKGVITFDELASEIGSVVTASSQLGIPFEQISAAMSEKTLRGISAAESATALESLMRSIMNPTDEARDTIKRLNAQNKDLNFQWDITTLRAKGLGGMMEDLSKASQGNFEVVGKLIPNIRGMRAAMVLAANDGKGFNEMLEEQAGRAGSTAKALEEADKSINRQLEAARAEWDAYKRSIGEVVAKLQLEFMKVLLIVAKYIDEHKEEIMAVIDAFKKYGQWVGNILKILKKFGEGTRDVMKGVSDFAKKIKDFIDGNKFLSWLGKAIDLVGKLEKKLLHIALMGPAGFFYDPPEKGQMDYSKYAKEYADQMSPMYGFTPLTGGITTPEVRDFPSLEELLGGDIDSATDKISKIIDKVTKEISEFYVDLGGFANDYTEALDEQADAFGESALKYSRFLEDIDTELSRLTDKHEKTIQKIEDDISDENRSFSDSMDDRAKKFEDTMDKMSQTHADKVEDLQHQLDLEIGMGLRADQEKIKELEKEMARENRDYAQSLADKTAEREDADADERRRNGERLEDLRERLAEEKLEYSQRTDDIKLEMDRELADYKAQQDEIRQKTADTLAGIVEDYQKAFKGIYDAIRESGVPSLLMQLPQITADALERSISGANVSRNLLAEQEYVNNWGGMYGRLPTSDEINMGVYGTSEGPTPVNVIINNPVVTDESYIDKISQQVQVTIGEAFRLAKNGAY